MKNHLGNHMYQNPHSCHQMMNRKELHETLMVSGGRVVAKGVFWNIKSKHLGAGAYKITLDKGK